MTIETAERPDIAVPEIPPSRGRIIARAARHWYGYAILAICALWLAYNVARRILTGRWHWATLLDAPPSIFLLLIPLLLLGASAVATGSRRRWAALVAVLGLLPGIDQTGVNFDALRFWGRSPVPAEALHVIVWNTNCWGDPNADPEAHYRFLRSQNADLYLLQEHSIWVQGTAEEEYLEVKDDAKLREIFPGYYIAHRSELITISKYPIVSTPLFGPAAELPADATFNETFLRDKVFRADIDVNGRILSTYNIHLTVPTTKDINYFNPRLPRDRDLDAYFRRKFAWRAAEIKGLVDDLKANPNPALIGGDFNTTASMGALDPLRAITTDATEASRQLVPRSWRLDGPEEFEGDTGIRWPLWRLDWSFTRGPVTVHRYDLRSSEGLSDHAVQELRITL